MLGNIHFVQNIVLIFPFHFPIADLYNIQHGHDHHSQNISFQNRYNATRAEKYISYVHKREYDSTCVKPRVALVFIINKGKSIKYASAHHHHP